MDNVGLIKHYLKDRTRNCLIAIIIPVIGLFFLFPVNRYAADLDGQLSSELYIWQNGNDNHIRPYERLRANLIAWRQSPYKVISFHTYLRATTDFSDKLAKDPQTYIYDAYLKLGGIPSNSEFRLGRQFVYSSVGSALLDGMSIRYRPVQSTRLEIFGGSAVSVLDPEQIQSLADYGAFGGRISYSAINSYRFGLNWMLRLNEGSVVYHRAGIDAGRQFGRLDLYARISYNVASLRLSELLGRAVYHSGKWLVSGEITRREPSVPDNSLFSLVDFYAYRQFRIELQRKFYGRLYLVAQFHANIYHKENSYQSGFGFRAGGYSLIWIHRQGYGGDDDGLQGYVMIRPAHQWELFASANFRRYRIQELQMDRSDNCSATIGINRKLGKTWTVRTEGQYLRNAISSGDYRLYFRISKDFSLKGNSGSSR